MAMKKRRDVLRSMKMKPAEDGEEEMDLGMEGEEMDMPEDEMADEDEMDMSAGEDRESLLSDILALPEEDRMWVHEQLMSEMGGEMEGEDEMEESEMEEEDILA